CSSLRGDSRDLPAFPTRRSSDLWLGGNGAAAIHNLMEDAATAEISRSQIWQWVNNGVRLEDGTEVTAKLVRDVLADVRAELADRSEEHTSELQSREKLVCRLLLE